MEFVKTKIGIVEVRKTIIGRKFFWLVKVSGRGAMVYPLRLDVNAAVRQYVVDCHTASQPKK